MNDVRVEVHGPIFDVRAERMVDQMLTEVQQEVAEVALFRWRMGAIETFRNPTGRYESHMQVVKRDRDDVVTDGWPGSRLQYGPWLEGVGSRNSPVTRFPGYFNLRKAYNYALQRWRVQAQPIIDKWVGRINEQGG